MNIVCEIKVLFVLITENLLHNYLSLYDTFPEPVIVTQRDVCLTFIDLSHQHLSVHQTLFTHRQTGSLWFNAP